MVVGAGYVRDAARVFKVDVQSLAVSPQHDVTGPRLAPLEWAVWMELEQ